MYIINCSLEFGLFAMKLGAGRAVKSDQLDYETGIIFHKKVGESVTEGEQIATIYGNENISEDMLTNFQKNVKIDKTSVKTKEIIEIIY